MADEIRYGQVELNRCAFLRDGAIESQCEAATDLENGRIVVVDKLNRKVYDATDESAPKTNIIYGINYTAERIYNQFTPGRKNFFVKKGECPRVGILSTGDIFTTDAYLLHEGDFAKLPKDVKLLAITKDEDGIDITNPDGSASVKYQVL